MSCLSLLFSTLNGPSLFCLTSISVLWSPKFPLFEFFLVLLYYSRDHHLQIYTYLFQILTLNDSKSLKSLIISSTSQSKHAWIELLFPCVCYFALMPSKSGHQCGRTAAVSLGSNSRLYQVWLSKGSGPGRSGMQKTTSLQASCLSQQTPPSVFCRDPGKDGAGL